MFSKCPWKASLRKKRLPVVSNNGKLDRESVVKEILTTAYAMRVNSYDAPPVDWEI